MTRRLDARGRDNGPNAIVGHFAGSRALAAVAWATIVHQWPRAAAQPVNASDPTSWAGAPISTLLGHTGGLTAVAWHPSGQWLLTGGSGNNIVALWGPGSPAYWPTAPTRTFRGHTNSVLAVAWAPSGLYAASASSDATVRIWGSGSNPAAWSATWLRLLSHPSVVATVSFLQGSAYLVSGSYDYETRLWGGNTNPATWSTSALRSFSQTASVTSGDASADGRWFAGGGFDRVFMYTGSGLPTTWPTAFNFSLAIGGEGYWTFAVAFSSSTRALAMGSVGGVAVFGGNSTNPLQWGRGPSLWLPASPNVYAYVGWASSELYLAAGSGGAVYLWGNTSVANLASWHAEPLRTLEVAGGTFTKVAWNPDGRWLAAGTSDGNVTLWGLRCPPNAVLAGDVCQRCNGTNGPSQDGLTCSPCYAGTYGFNGTCLRCANNTWSPGGGLAACLPCPPRTFTNVNATACNLCPSGTWLTNQTSCQLCGPGGVSAVNATACSFCPAGSSPDPTRSTCIGCPADTASPDGVSCEACPGRRIAAPNSTACSVCPVGEWLGVVREDASVCRSVAADGLALYLTIVSGLALLFMFVWLLVEVKSVVQDGETRHRTMFVLGVLIAVADQFTDGLYFLITAFPPSIGWQAPFGLLMVFPTFFVAVTAATFIRHMYRLLTGEVQGKGLYRMLLREHMELHYFLVEAAYMLLLAALTPVFFMLYAALAGAQLLTFKPIADMLEDTIGIPANLSSVVAMVTGDNKEEADTAAKMASVDLWQFNIARVMEVALEALPSAIFQAVVINQLRTEGRVTGISIISLSLSWYMVATHTYHYGVRWFMGIPFLKVDPTESYKDTITRVRGY
jgi:WD40 repeat protein